MKALLVTALLFLSPLNKLVSPVAYKAYCNARFGYCINYPDFLIAEPESENGDGRIFVNKERTEILRVYGRLNQDAEGNPVTLKNQYLLDVKNLTSPETKATYKKLGTSYYVISGEQEGNIFYRKVIIKDDAFCYAILRYDKLEKAKYDAVAGEIYRSFK